MSSSSHSAAAGDLAGGGGFSPAAVPTDPWQPTGPEHSSIADPWQPYAQVGKSPGVAQQVSNQSSTPTFMSIAQQLAQAPHGPPGLRTAASSSGKAPAVYFEDTSAAAAWLGYQNSARPSPTPMMPQFQLGAIPLSPPPKPSSIVAPTPTPSWVS